MRKAPSARRLDPDRDTMRPEYDFSGAVRGVTAARYAAGTNIVVIDPDVLDVFPDSAAVNNALRALAPVLRHQRTTRARHPRVVSPRPKRPTSERRTRACT